MNTYDESVCCMALNSIFGFQPRIALAMIEALGSAGAVFELHPYELYELLGPHSKYRAQLNHGALEDAFGEMNKVLEMGGRFIGITSPEYPAALKDCYDPPVGLYVKSPSPLEEVFARRNPYVSIVGTRDMTPYGKEWCEKIVAAFGQSASRPVVVSGLAYGVDITAHRAALEAGLPTIACMATGIDAVYPYRHYNIAERIATEPGCALVSDFPLCTTPLQPNFLRRNRIIAGLSEATILIESKSRGGGLLTADLAFSYGREVLALPGRGDDICSQGCNKLIFRKVAEPIYDTASLLKELNMLPEKRRTKALELREEIYALYGDSQPPERLADMIRTALQIKKNRGVTLDELSFQTGIPPRELSTICSLMESDGILSVDLLQRCSINRK